MSGIRSDSKMIINCFLQKAIQSGSLNNQIFLDYKEIANILKKDDINYCRICCEYLERKHFITVSFTSKNDVFIQLTATGIDFLETDII